jgi:hypothetical protein
MAKYGKKAQEKVEETMREMKEGKLTSGKSGKKVKSREQAIAIGLSEARKEGAKVPEKKSSGATTGTRKKSGTSEKRGTTKTKTKKTASDAKATSSRKKTTGARKKSSGGKSASGAKK